MRGPDRTCSAAIGALYCTHVGFPGDLQDRSPPFERICTSLRHTSLGEASARTEATDPQRRETPRVRTGAAGIRRSPKWLGPSGAANAALGSTPRSAEARPGGVIAGTLARRALATGLG